MASDFNESVSIEVDWKSTEKKLKKLSDVAKNGFNKGLKVALNETIDPDGGKNMKKFALEQMRKQYTVKTTRLDRNGKVQLERATLSKLSASVYTKGRPNSLTYFHYRRHKNSQGRKKGTGAPAKAKVFVQSSLNTIPRAFVAKMPNGHIGMFERNGGKHHPKRGRYSTEKYKNVKSREKLKQFLGPGTSQMLWNEDVSQAIEKELENRFDKAVDIAIDKIIQKAMK